MAASRILTPRGRRKTLRRCLSLKTLKERSCVRCRRHYAPQRRWQRFCSKRCRWSVHDKRKADKRQKRPLIGTKERPFGTRRCPSCRGDFIATRSTKKYCSHACFRRRMSRKWMNENRARGLCYACKSPPISGRSSWCERHWLTQLAWRSGLRGRGSGDRLKRLLIQQNYRCAYTGRKLTIGVNASVDHINPRSLYPHLIGKINNLEWVDEDVNRAKRTMSRTEFISMCREVVRRFAGRRRLQAHQTALGFRRAQG